jgi:hypothetical protein
MRRFARDKETKILAPNGAEFWLNQQILNAKAMSLQTGFVSQTFPLAHHQRRVENAACSAIFRAWLRAP